MRAYVTMSFLRSLSTCRRGTLSRRGVLQLRTWTGVDELSSSFDRCNSCGVVVVVLYYTLRAAAHTRRL